MTKERASRPKHAHVFDLTRSKVTTPRDNVLRPASRYGREYNHWNGFDVTITARPAKGLRLQGGVSAGKTTMDNCDVVAKLDDPTPLYCHVETSLLVDTKLWAAHPLPWGARIAVTFQSSPGLGGGSGISATYLYSELPGLGRTTSAPGGMTSVNLIAPGTQYGARVNQVDLRLARLFRAGRTALDVRLDVYNALNASAVLTWNNTYGSRAPSLTWRTPESIIQGRIIELGVHGSW